METVLDRFLRYVKVDTQSDEDSKNTPSTQKQFDLAKILKKECEEMNLSEISLDDKCYVMATLESNLGEEGKEVPVVGFICHMDTSPDAPGANVEPIVHKNYNGKDILLNEKEKIVLTVKDNPDLSKYVGQDIVTSDGTTLLGSDDKSGIAEVMTAVKYFVDNPDVKHGKIRIGFTPDEEIGQGTDFFDVKKFGCKYAFTIDGGEIGEISYETFNAASTKVNISGKNVHPGYAKGILVNAMKLVMEYNALLPEKECPEHVEGREGYYHILDFGGNVNSAWAKYLIRDFDRKKFEERKEFMKKIGEDLNKKYKEKGGKVEVEIKDSYYNMFEKVKPFYDDTVAKVIKAMEEEDVKPLNMPTRGGTDGANLSFMGLPTPNIFAGGHNFHSKSEYVPVQSMEKAVKVIIRLIKNYAKK